jgi:hypothetical protein
LLGLYQAGSDGFSMSFLLLEGAAQKTSSLCVCRCCGGSSPLRLARWCRGLCRFRRLLAPEVQRCGSLLVVKNQSCLVWGVLRLRNDGAPRSYSLRRCLDVGVVELLWKCAARLGKSELLVPCV